MGGTNSRPHTRPATPFNPSFSVPTTPPDLYLVTRNSPNLSQSLWENFQPDQLFPESSQIPLPQMSPSQNQQSLDPNLVSPMQPGMSPQSPGQAAPFLPRMPNKSTGTSPQQANNFLQPGLGGYQTQTQTNNNSLWPGGGDVNTGMPDGQSPSDSWSTGSAQGQPVPATLNVEDWFQFFGINGNDVNLSGFDIPLG